MIVCLLHFIFLAIASDQAAGIILVGFNLSQSYL